MDKFDIARRVRLLNEASDAYYNTGNPIMSDSQFDQLLDELKEWEDETGIVLSNSPTQNVGAANLDVYPRGSLVETSLGTAIVVDTGGFADSDPYQIDIAVTW